MEKDSDHTQKSHLYKTPGRGALSNASGRFEALRRVDYTEDLENAPFEREIWRTKVEEERPRSALSYNSAPDIPFDRSVNPYRGCEHGCIYCYARPGHAWLGLSPGLDFETHLIARPLVASVLRQEISKPSYTAKTLILGSFTDPYQPIEARYRSTRQILELMQETRHPVTIITKGALISRDLDILSAMAAAGLVSVGISVTSLRAEITRVMEPRVPAPARRFEVIKELSDAGVPVRVMASPLVPGLTDHELEGILAKGAEAGATRASWIMLRLPREVAPLFEEWLLANFPNHASKVLKLIREMHDGALYSSTWHKRMKGSGTYAELVAQRFKTAARRLGLSGKHTPLRTDLFQKPKLPNKRSTPRNDPRQFSLFD